MAEVFVLSIGSEVALHLLEVLLQLDVNGAAFGRVDSLIDSDLVLIGLCLLADWRVEAAAGVGRVESRDGDIAGLQIELLCYRWLTLV